MSSKKDNSSEKGQSIIEFALFLPIILLIVFVAIQISIIAYYRLVVNQVLTDIARTVAVVENPEDPTCQNRITSILDFYTDNAIIPMQINDSSLFTWKWSREQATTINQMIIVQCEYHGMRLPFIDDYVISDALCYPSIFSPPTGT